MTAATAASTAAKARAVFRDMDYTAQFTKENGPEVTVFRAIVHFSPRRLSGSSTAIAKLG
jgi:hypothetical protein